MGEIVQGGVSSPVPSKKNTIRKVKSVIIITLNTIGINIHL
jgi:hypothetical protein